MNSNSLASAMYEDLGISTQTKPPLVDIATPSVKNNLDKKSMSSRRRPLPPSLIRGAAPPSELPMTPRPPLALPSANPRPSSGTRSSGMSSLRPIPPLAVAEAANDADMLRLRFALAELQAKCDRQARELAELRGQHHTGNDFLNRTMPLVSSEPNTGIGLLASTAPATVLGHVPKPAVVEQACQTDERAFSEQLDLILKDAAHKGKDLRKTQETVRMLRGELEQEKVVSEQHREQAERLELQLREVQQRQQRADSERTLVEWHLRNGGGSASRSCTPQPGTSRAMKAWGESGRSPEDLDMPLSGGDLACDNGAGRSSFGNLAFGNQSPPVHSLSDTLYRNRFDELGDAESAGSDSEEVEVYHPPPSRKGLR